MASEFDPVNSRLSAIESRLTTLDNDVRSIRDDVSALKGSATTLKWMFGILCTIVVGATTLIGTLAGTMGRSWVAEIAREVLRQEIAYRSTTVQLGKFTAANRLPDDPRSFAWTLRVPVEPDKVTLLAAEPLTPLPGIAITAKLDDGGKRCVMTLHGDDAAIAALPDSIDAKVTIASRQ